MLSKIMDVILPPRCLVTGNTVDRQGMLAPEAWSELKFISVPQCFSCGFPFEFSLAEQGVDETLCLKCISIKNNFDSARAPLVYDDASREMILKFKHADQTHAIKTFIPWLRMAGQDVLSRADAIAPVPLHRWRLLLRRYNQAALLARGLASETGLRCEPELLIRNRATPSQGNRSADERHKNVRDAFQVNPRRLKNLANKTIVLVDDVYTTGATVNECARVLKKAGAAAVHVLTVTRVVRASNVD